MSEKLQEIEAQLYMSELTFPLLREQLLRHGEIRAWYRYYRGGNQWAKKFYREENVFLVDQVIIWHQTAENGEINIFSIKLNEFSKIQRSYTFESKHSQKLVLSEVTATLRTMDKKSRPDVVVFKRPLAEEEGDAAGFEEFMTLLD